MKFQFIFFEAVGSFVTLPAPNMQSKGILSYVSVVWEAICSDIRHSRTVHVESFQALRPVCDVLL